MAFIKLLKPNDIVLDIGANVGAMTAMFARAVPQGHVYGYEPIDEPYNAAKRVLRLSRIHNATLFMQGLSDRKHTKIMIMPQKNGVRYEGLSHVLQGGQGMDGGRSYHVHMEKLDDECRFTAGKQINAIKIDVEDHEQYVIRGGLNLIKVHRPIIYCELWSEENKAECFRLLTELEYTPYVAIKRELRRYESCLHANKTNYFFLPPAVLQEIA